MKYHSRCVAWNAGRGANKSDGLSALSYQNLSLPVAIGEAFKQFSQVTVSALRRNTILTVAIPGVLKLVGPSESQSWGCDPLTNPITCVRTDPHVRLALGFPGKEGINVQVPFAFLERTLLVAYIAAGMAPVNGKTAFTPTLTRPHHPAWIQRGCQRAMMRVLILRGAWTSTTD